MNSKCKVMIRFNMLVILIHFDNHILYSSLITYSKQIGIYSGHIRTPHF